MTYPRILRVHPKVIPNNVDSIVKLEFNKTSLHDLSYLKVRFHTYEYNMS